MIKLKINYIKSDKFVQELRTLQNPYNYRFVHMILSKRFDLISCGENIYKLNGNIMRKQKEYMDYRNSHDPKILDEIKWFGLEIEHYLNEQERLKFEIRKHVYLMQNYYVNEEKK